MGVGGGWWLWMWFIIGLWVLFHEVVLYYVLWWFRVCVCVCVDAVGIECILSGGVMGGGRGSCCRCSVLLLCVFCVCSVSWWVL